MITNNLLTNENYNNQTLSSPICYCDIDFVLVMWLTSKYIKCKRKYKNTCSRNMAHISVNMFLGRKLPLSFIILLTEVYFLY